MAASRRDTRSAAIFDLDRTLIAGASWPVFAHCLHQAGVMAEPLPGLAKSMFSLFRAFGESQLTMQVTKAGIRRTTGWPLAGVDQAARSAVSPLLAQLQPYATGLFDAHRKAGHRLVLATTTPHRLVAPLAETLGFDAVVATRYGISGDAFDGTIDGPFVWNRGKLEAVRVWAREAGVDLSSSFAYSDSYYDSPLLSSVGHPTAVNPDLRLAGLAQLAGWPVRWLDKPVGVVKIGGLEVQELFRPFAREELWPNARFTFAGLENLPAQGGAVICANHRSYFDPTVLAITLAKARRTARFLGKKEVFDAPIIGSLARALGGIRVDRGSGSDEPLTAAIDALSAGDVVAVMPQGTIPRGPAFFEPELKGRWGAARLAAEAGVPVIPVGLWGTDVVWPRSARVPRFDLVNPPDVTVVVGPALTLSGGNPELDTKRIMRAIADLLPAESRRPRTPSEEELRRTYPPGHSGGSTVEVDRRPGTD